MCRLQPPAIQGIQTLGPSLRSLTLETNTSKTQEKGWEEVEEGKGRAKGGRRDLILGGEHTMQCADDIIELYT